MPDCWLPFATSFFFPFLPPPLHISTPLTIRFADLNCYGRNRSSHCQCQPNISWGFYLLHFEYCAIGYISLSVTHASQHQFYYRSSFSHTNVRCKHIHGSSTRIVAAMLSIKSFCYRTQQRTLFTPAKHTFYPRQKRKRERKKRSGSTCIKAFRHIVWTRCWVFSARHFESSLQSAVDLIIAFDFLMLPRLFSRTLVSSPSK